MTRAGDGTTPSPPPGDLAHCVMCGVATEVDGCCSAACAQRAEREIKRNAVLLQRSAAMPVGEERRRLVERNGRMLSALLRWRAADAQGTTADVETRTGSSGQGT